MHIGQNICQIREIRNVKQVDIARRLGMTQQAYSKIERCAIVGNEMVERIAAALGVPPDIFTKYNGDQVIENICGGNAMTIQVVLNYTVSCEDSASLSDLTREIEDIVSRQQKKPSQAITPRVS